MKLSRAPKSGLLVIVALFAWWGPVGCSKEEPAEPPEARSAEPTPATTPNKQPSQRAAPIAEPSTRLPAENQPTLRDALASALEQTSAIRFEGYGSVEADTRVSERERVWREDQLGELPCVSGYKRARQTVRAVAKLLDDSQLHEWLESSLRIAQDSDLQGQLLGDIEQNNPRRWSYIPQLVVEAVYNLARDPQQKARALEIWEQMEIVRVEETKERTEKQLARLRALESPTLDDRLVLQALEQRVIERRQIEEW
ncbi:MAG: hypothetical protein ACYSUI_08220 [Planctomycetota bacterium]